MTNLEFIKKSKLTEIIDDIVTDAIYADTSDQEWLNELFALKWLLNEKKPQGSFANYLKNNEKNLTEVQNWIEESLENMELPFQDKE